MRDALVMLVAPLLLWPSSGRSEDSHDRLIVGASYQDFPDTSGDSASVDFVRSSLGRVFSFGAETVAVAETRWSVVRGSVYRKLDGGVEVLGDGAVGPGSMNGESFSYERLQAGATIPLRAGWRLVARDTFVDVEPVRGHVLTLGANVRHGVATTQFEISQAVGGNIEQRSVGFRIDGRIRKSAVFAGGLVGDSNNRLLLNEVGAIVAETKMRQVYAGMTWMLGKVDLTTMIGVAASGSTHRQSIGAVVGIPLGSR